MVALNSRLTVTRWFPCTNSVQVSEISSIAIPPNSNTFSDWRKTCHVPWVKLTNSGSLNSNMNFRLARDQVVLLETAANLWASRRKANDFSAGFFYFWTGRSNKTLNDWPRGKQWVLFPLHLEEGLGETKLTVSLGVSHYVLIVLKRFSCALQVNVGLTFRFEAQTDLKLVPFCIAQ